MDATKVVDLATRNSDQLILHFSDFSTNLYRFYKFAVFENKRKGKRNFAVGPLEVFVSKQSGPWPDLELGRVGRPNSGEETRRRRGVGGGKEEGVEAHLWVVSGLAGMAGRSSPA